jgi:hypothetical protein
MDLEHAHVPANPNHEEHADRSQRVGGQLDATTNTKVGALTQAMYRLAKRGCENHEQTVSEPVPRSYPDDCSARSGVSLSRNRCLNKL